MWMRLRTSLRLIEAAPRIEFHLVPHNCRRLNTHVDTSLHRFHETIGGRPYLIEVAQVGTDRWRAYIVRIPGVPTALMPFYGPTPGEAAGELREWLTRAYERAASNPVRVAVRPAM